VSAIGQRSDAKENRVPILFNFNIVGPIDFPKIEILCCKHVIHLVPSSSLYMQFQAKSVKGACVI